MLSEQLKTSEADEYRALFKSAMNAVLSLSSDVLASGPGGRALAENVRGGVEMRLRAALSDLEGIASELRKSRRVRLKSQLAALGISPTAENLKLHIGCGPHTIPTWINMDVYPAELALDIRWGLPFREGSASYVFFCHGLEHLRYPHEALRVLRDIRRVLAKGGVLRIVVPDIEQCLRAYAADDQEFFESRRSTWHWWPDNLTKLEYTLFYAGASNGLTFSSHRFGYDFETLQAALEKAGFSRIVRSEFMASAHLELQVDKYSQVAAATCRGRHYSLFVEATV